MCDIHEASIPQNDLPDFGRGREIEGHEATLGASMFVLKYMVLPSLPTKDQALSKLSMSGTTVHSSLERST